VAHFFIGKQSSKNQHKCLPFLLLSSKADRRVGFVLIDMVNESYEGVAS
tara:strand:- start:415 stop:561 length:147 start_codon:yes stop_codon:yes gene_type:complete